MNPDQNQQVNPQTPITAQTPNQQPLSDQPVSGVPVGAQSGSGNTPPANQEHGTSKTRNIIAILLLIFFYFIGVIYVFLFTKWPKWAKIVILLPIPLTILLIIGSIALVSSNPTKQFEQADNVQRASDVNQIINSVGTYANDNNGELPSGISATAQEISSDGVDICSDLVSTYIASLPVDPSLENASYTSDCTGPYSTGYYIVKNEDGTITVSAPMAEGDTQVSITR